MPEAEFNPTKALMSLSARRVEYVVVGAVAAAMHGSTYGTRDLDIMVRQTAANRRRLAAALTDLNARVLGGRKAPVPIAPELLKGMRILTFETSAGEIDVLSEATGGFAFASLERRAEKVDVGHHDVYLVHIDDLIAMKRASGRAKDIDVVEELEFLREEGRLRGGRRS